MYWARIVKVHNFIRVCYAHGGSNSGVHITLIIVHTLLFGVLTPLVEGVLSHCRCASDLVCYTHSIFYSDTT